MINLNDLAKKIRCVICDLDGVLTDGRIYLDNMNNEFKSFYIHDGLGLKLLMCAGIEVCLITGSKNLMIENRMNQLGIKHYFLGQTNKQQAYDTIKSSLNLNDDEIAYVGDDLPDRPIMQQVGLSFAVCNAVKEVKDISHAITKRKGGKGAVREICDLILYAQNKFDAALEIYLNS